MAKTKPLQIEQKIIKDLDARPHANSGAMAKKHDGSDEDYLYEIKTTGRGSYSIKRQYLETLVDAALDRLRDPALIVCFDPAEFTPESTFVIIQYEKFKELKDGSNA